MGSGGGGVPVLVLLPCGQCCVCGGVGDHNRLCREILPVGVL